MNASFFNTQVSFQTKRLVLGLIIGLSYSFSLYGLFVVVREAVRLMSFDHVFNFWVLNEQEVDFYNLVYAFIAVIFGQSACFSFWAEGTGKKLRMYPLRQLRIIHDQRFFNFSFLMWFSQLAFLYGLFFGFSHYEMNSDLSFYPQYRIIFVFFILVLFLQSWVSIRLVFKRKSLVWMLLSALLVTFLSFGLSNIKIVDNKKLDAAVRKGNLLLNYSFDRPESDFYQRSKVNLVSFIYVGLDRTGQLKEPVMIVDNQKIQFTELPGIIDQWFSYLNMYDKDKLTVVLYIDKQVSTRFVVKLKKILQENGVSRVGYGVVPIHGKEFHANTSELYFPWRLLPIDSAFFHPDSSYQRAKAIPYTFKIRPINKDAIQFGETTIDRHSLRDMLLNQIRSNPKTTFHYYINESLPFENYFSILSESKSVIDSLRNEEALRTYPRNYNNLRWKEQQPINEKYPFRVYEMSEGMVRQYETADSLNYTDHFGKQK